MDKQVLITQIIEVVSELGEPDCKLIEPYSISYIETTDDLILTSWMYEYSLERTFMIHSDKILTLADPTPTLLRKYEDLIK